MPKRKRRSHLFIHASSQGKYIALSILPALLMAVYTLYVVYVGTWPAFRAAIETPRITLTESRTLLELGRSPKLTETVSRETLLSRLDGKLAIMDAQLVASHAGMLAAWHEVRVRIAAGLFGALVCTALLALLYSHRLVGPLTRIRSDLDALAAGETIGPVNLRKYDELQDLAAALELLRQRLNEPERPD